MEDDQGYIDFIIPKNIYDKAHPVLAGLHFYIVEGKIQTDGPGITIIVKSIKTFQKSKSKPSGPGPSHREMNHSMGWM